MASCLIQKSSNLKIQLILLLSCFFVTNLWAQKTEQFRLIQAEYLNSIVVEGVQAQKLVGEVQFEYQGALMYCDSAYYFSETRSIEAFSSVRINQGDTLNLYGDRLHYDGNTRLATVRGKEVQLITSDFVLTTDLLYYDRILNRGSYVTNATIISHKDSNKLKSKRGYYYSDQSLFMFKDSVVLTNPEFEINSDTLRYNTNTEIAYFLGPTYITGDSNLIYCENGWYDTRQDQSEFYQNSYIISDGKKLEGDTLYYDRNLEFGQADGNMQITDTANNIFINGEHAEIFEARDSAIVTNECLLTQIADKDTLFMTADTFKVYTGVKGEQFLLAYYEVVIYKEDLQGRCDSIAYVLDDSTINMYRDPILWSEQNQLTADTISLRLKGGKIHSMFLDQNSFVISEVDSIRYNQIKGKQMTAYFKEGDLSKIEVRGNGQTTYYGQDDKDQFIGINIAESSDIDIKIKDQSINSITFLNQPDASMHPMGSLDPLTELRYKGFRWRIEEKPLSKEDLKR